MMTTQHTTFDAFWNDAETIKVRAEAETREENRKAAASAATKAKQEAATVRLTRQTAPTERIART